MKMNLQLMGAIALSMGHYEAAMRPVLLQKQSPDKSNRQSQRVLRKRAKWVK